MAFINSSTGFHPLSRWSHTSVMLRFVVCGGHDWDNVKHCVFFYPAFTTLVVCLRSFGPYLLTVHTHKSEHKDLPSCHCWPSVVPCCPLPCRQWTKTPDGALWVQDFNLLLNLQSFLWLVYLLIACKVANSAMLLTCFLIW